MAAYIAQLDYLGLGRAYSDDDRINAVVMSWNDDDYGQKPDLLFPIVSSTLTNITKRLAAVIARERERKAETARKRAELKRQKADQRRRKRGKGAKSRRQNGSRNAVIKAQAAVETPRLTEAGAPQNGAQDDANGQDHLPDNGDRVMLELYAAGEVRPWAYGIKLQVELSHEDGIVTGSVPGDSLCALRTVTMKGTPTKVEYKVVHELTTTESGIGDRLNIQIFCRGTGDFRHQRGEELEIPVQVMLAIDVKPTWKE